MYHYHTFEDGTEVVHSGLHTRDGNDEALVHFESPTANGFDSARCSLPSYTWTAWEGRFTGEELACFEEFLKANERSIYQRGAE
jgi:hypothetical protein